MKINLFCLGLLLAIGTARASTFSDVDWQPLGSGVQFSGYDAAVNALAVSGGTLYVGGFFTNAGGVSANYLAQWNGASWSAVGSGLGVGELGNPSPAAGDVNALAVSGSTVYAAGDFVDNIATNLAQWNGNSWSALGGSPPGVGFGLMTVSGGSLYVDDSHTVHQWNGNSWLALGGAWDGGVFAEAASDNTVYIGGSFSWIGPPPNGYPPTYPISAIAQLNGTNWSAVGSYPNGEVTALLASGNLLFAGDSGGKIAQWDGENWTELGVGVGSKVSALAVSGGTLYAAYYSENSAWANVAQWNGTNWSDLSSGFGVGESGPSVLALAVSGNTLFAGGNFTTIGANTNVFNGIAQINLSVTPACLAIVTTNAAFGLANGVFGFDMAGPTGSNVIIQASTNLQTWIPLQTNLLTNGLLYFSDPQFPTNTPRFYRGVLQ